MAGGGVGGRGWPTSWAMAELLGGHWSWRSGWKEVNEVQGESMSCRLMLCIASDGRNAVAQTEDYKVKSDCG